MPDVQRCDAVVWDVSGSLSGGLRGQLRERTERQGPKFGVEIGEWLDRRLAIGRPRRVIAKHAPTFAEVLDALVAAHHPRRLIVIGPAASLQQPLGAALIESPEGLAAAGLPSGSINTGAIASSDPPTTITTDWADACRRAADHAGVGIVMVAVVTVTARSGPPASRPRTLSRTAGQLLGQVLAGKTPEPVVDRRALNAATDAVAAIIRTT